MKDLQVAFLKSQIPHQDIPQDTAFFSALYKFARKHKVKYVLTEAIILLSVLESQMSGV